MLSALFLLLAIMLGGQWPLAPQAAAAPQSSTDLGSTGHRSKPFVTKQQFLVAEARDAKATPWDDGKGKALPQAAGVELAPAPANLVCDTQLAGITPRAASSGFQARAPPFQS